MARTRKYMHGKRRRRSPLKQDDNIGFSEQHNSYYDKDINEIRNKLDYQDVEYEDLQKQYLYEKKGRKKFNSEKEEGKRRRKSMKKKGWGPDYSELG